MREMESRGARAGARAGAEKAAFDPRSGEQVGIGARNSQPVTKHRFRGGGRGWRGGMFHVKHPLAGTRTTRM